MQQHCGTLKDFAMIPGSNQAGANDSAPISVAMRMIDTLSFLAVSANSSMINLEGS
jgi:hypothetical protein